MPIDLARRTMRRSLELQFGTAQTAAAIRARPAPQPAQPKQRERFRVYIKRVKPDYEFNRWSEILIALLQQVADGELKRLIVTIPPQHGKTELASRLFPAYYLSLYPLRHVGLTTYDGGISYGLSRAARRYFKAGGGSMAPDSQNVGQWNTAEGGGLWATGVGGAVTSRPAHLLVGDDWIKGQREADSTTVRRDVHTFYSPTWRSRLQKDGAIFLIGTRWHAMDLIGYVLKLEETSGRPEGWTILDLPAISESATERVVYPSTCKLMPDWREIGEPLCPERYDLNELLDLQASMQPRHWSAVYQCRPSAAEGVIFKREWLNWYDPQKPLPRFARIIISLDATFKNREKTSDFCGFTVWGQFDRDFWLLDSLSKRMDFVQTLQQLLAFRKQYSPSAILIEDAANGPAIISSLRQKVHSLVAVTPDGSKEARAFSTQPIFLQGRVWVPAGPVPWMADWTDHVLNFPGGEGRDLADSTTQALRWLQEIAGGARTTEASWGEAPLNWHWASDQSAIGAPQDPFADVIGLF